MNKIIRKTNQIEKFNQPMVARNPNTGLYESVGMLYCTMLWGMGIEWDTAAQCFKTVDFTSKQELRLVTRNGLTKATGFYGSIIMERMHSNGWFREQTLLRKVGAAYMRQYEKKDEVTKISDEIFNPLQPFDKEQWREQLLTCKKGSVHIELEDRAYPQSAYPNTVVLARAVKAQYGSLTPDTITLEKGEIKEYFLVTKDKEWIEIQDARKNPVIIGLSQPIPQTEVEKPILTREEMNLPKVEKDGDAPKVEEKKVVRRAKAKA